MDDALQRALDMVTPTMVFETDVRAYPSDVEGNTGFSVSRFRPGLSFRPTSWLFAVSSFDLLGGERPSVLDAFVRLQATKAISFDIGQSKPPLFPSFVYELDQALPFPDRAPVVQAFHVQRDIGADVHVAPPDIPIEAWFRMGSGSGSPAGNAAALPAMYGALDFVNRFVRVGVAGLTETVLDRDSIFGVTPMGFTYFRPINVTGHRMVSESHVIAWLGPVRVMVEGALAKEQRSKDTDGNPKTPRADLPALYAAGMTAEIAWTILGRPRSSGRAPYETDAPKQQRGSWKGGALEIAARFDRVWLGRGATDVELGGMIGGAGSIKWWPIDFFYVDVAAYGTRYDGPPIEEPDRQLSWGVLARTGFVWGYPGQPSSRLGTMLLPR